MGTQYIDNPCHMSDRFINRLVIKNVILLRGSWKIFGDGAAAEAYLESLKTQTYRFENKKYQSRVQTVGKTDCLVFPGESKIAVLYLHGGAFVRHITSLHLKMIDAFSRQTGASFFAPVYLTAPQHTWRESTRDIVAIYRKMLETYHSDHIIFMGDSAGGTIAVSLLHTLRAQGLPLPQKLIMLSPMLELDCKNTELQNMAPADPMFGGTDGIEVCVRSWAGDAPLDSADIDPMQTDFASLPETHIFIGSSDMLFPDDRLFYEKAREAGAPVNLYVYQDMYHVFPLYPLRAAREAKQLVANLIATTADT